MSQENVELTARYYAFWNRTLDINATFERFFHEDACWVEPPESPNAGEFAGRVALTGYIRDWVEHMGPPRFEVCELLPSGDEVVAVVRVETRGTGSGVRLPSVPLIQVFRWEDRKLLRVRVFYERQEAFEAVALRE